MSKACKKCRRIVEEKTCPICGSTDLSKKWKGEVIIYDPENSEIAKELGFTAPGKYAIRVK